MISRDSGQTLKLVARTLNPFLLNLAHTTYVKRPGQSAQ